MIKYTDTQIVFKEIPDEITLAINISGCPNNCIGCHSPHLSFDIGMELTSNELFQLIKNNSGITCVSFMGGDQDPEYINNCASILREKTSLKIAWYSGKDKLSSKINIKNFDYIKLGPYIFERGPLNNINTNQHLYEVIHYTESIKNSDKKDILNDITYKFWK